MGKKLILVLAFLAAGLFMVRSNHSAEQNIDKQFAQTSPYPTVFNSENSNITDDDIITPSASKNIEVISPLMGDNIKSGFVVKGNARTFENTVNIRLLDSLGNILNETSTTANASDVGQFGPFETQLSFDTTDSDGKLEVFQYNAKDGSEIDKVEIPVVFNK